MPTPSTPKRVAIPIELQWNVPWHLDCFQGIVDYGDEQGWDCVVDPYLNGPTGEGELSNYDGVVGRIPKQDANRIADFRLPAVNLVKIGDDDAMHVVRVDAITGTRLAGEHLIAHGYRKFGHVSIALGGRDDSDPTINAFAQTITAQGFPAPALIGIHHHAIDHAETLKTCLKSLTEWIKTLDKPVGLYVYLFDIARYLTQICAQIGLRIPEDVGMVVMDADTVNTTHVTPTLSAIEFDYWEQGYQAAAVLDRLMRGERVDPRNKLIQPRRVIVRESTDVFVCEDELVSKAMRLIAERCRQAVTAEDIADELEISRRTLDRRLEAAQGQTINYAILQQRLKQIENLLIESELTMTSLADLFSFGSASQFTQFFKKQTGMTPTAYRKHYRKEH